MNSSLLSLYAGHYHKTWTTLSHSSPHKTHSAQGEREGVEGGREDRCSPDGDDVREEDDIANEVNEPDPSKSL